MNIAETIHSRIADKYFTFTCEYESIIGGINRFGTERLEDKTVYSFKCLQVPESKSEKGKFNFTVNGIAVEPEGYVLASRIELENVGVIVEGVNKMKAGDYFKIGTQRYEVIGLPNVAPDIKDPSGQFVLVKIFYRKEL